MTTLLGTPDPRPAPIAPHEHAWLTESRHATSEGVVVYVRCAGCDVRRVDLHALGAPAPAAMSVDVTG
ncbi:hypothetical protein [Microbacterium marinilacus]|uniref:Uncharacterized protein n=1 Tax=Microbacterium marinilacus TaxID=415209 RepID=A0ABP7BUM4_9MICO|nr:hypothetical protein [Microbacterium marinilacus]MBY0689135.1 hypothetical protein [Microbacterium marinilacus]